MEHDYPRVVAAVALVCGSRAAAEDAVQEALARAWERRQHVLSLKAWVMAVSLNISRSWFRRVLAERRAKERLAVPGPDEGHEDVIDVRTSLAALPRRQREAVVLHYYLGFSVAETSRSLGLAEGTVKGHLFRAREALARTVTDHDDEETDVGSR